ncbi:hypothetical protein [Nocardioides sp. cx-173]|uniref:hypothetical protein n=1 Tax=Nocardioides sp. cx-173 TaxID=2898796 RepID=UPI001E470B3C|nr:hypothetical protein [Nocardioides sp. cx-173]MCD4525582.1 hypothetical protein [Nocardioides sp. cx-173]UGB42726.1 hypothetical protein LQ940_04165 [Nocardioides sp. cx-173]
MRRRPLSALALVTVCSLAGCGLLPGSDLDEALEVIPADATTVTYVGRAAFAEREGVDDVETGADDEELRRYLEAATAAASTSLTRYLGIMQEAAFTDLDVQWEVVASGADSGPWTAWKIDDDLDLDDVGDDLVDAGYEESEIGGERAFTTDLGSADPDTQLVGGRYPVGVMSQVVLVPDEHLILAGADPEALLDVVTDDEDSLVDAQDFEEVVGVVDDPEFAHLQRDLDCAAALGGATGEDDSGQAEPMISEAGLEDLRRPDATAFFVHGDDAETTTVLGFADADTAEADASAREAWLEDGGRLLRTQQPIDDIADWSVEADDSLVRVDHAFDEGIDWAARAALAGDGFTLCAP